MSLTLSASLDPSDRDFCAPAEMSPGLERSYRKTLERFSARPGTGARAGTAIVPKLSTRIIVDGQEFESTGEMPPALRRFYEETLTRALPLQRAVYTVARIERANAIKRTATLAVIVFGYVSTIVYLWSIGYYR